MPLARRALVKERLPEQPSLTANDALSCATMGQLSRTVAEQADTSLQFAG
ncbi:hypothetical protein Tco_0602776, partial [Tanacetum coccineum]